MRHQGSAEQCTVPGCPRYTGKIRGFCNRCWALASDGERAQVLFSRHAPLWPRTIRGDESDERDGTPDDPMSVVTMDRWYGLMFGGIPAGQVLAAVEASMTEHIVARNIADRRRFRNIGDNS